MRSQLETAIQLRLLSTIPVQFEASDSVLIERYSAYLKVSFYSAYLKVSLYSACLKVSLYSAYLKVSLYSASLKVSLYSASLKVSLYSAHYQIVLIGESSVVDIVVCQVERGPGRGVAENSVLFGVAL